MIALTSISLQHINDQEQAIKSWLQLGLNVYSFNSKEEIKALKGIYKDVNFIETQRVLDKTYGKPVVSISAMIDFAKQQNDKTFMFINSDIELRNDLRLIAKISEQLQQGLILANRFEYSDVVDKDSTLHQYFEGIDVFCLHKDHLEIYPQTMFAMGQCFWDYWIPFTALQNGLDVFLLQNRFAFHREHKLQYSNDNWLLTGRYFRLHAGLYQFDDSTKGISNMSTFVKTKIYRNAIKKTL